LCASKFEPWFFLPIELEFFLLKKNSTTDLQLLRASIFDQQLHVLDSASGKPTNQPQHLLLVMLMIGKTGKQVVSKAGAATAAAAGSGWTTVFFSKVIRPFPHVRKAAIRFGCIANNKYLFCVNFTHELNLVRLR
jgi:hypothetical protein